MIATKIDCLISKAAPLLVVAAVSSLGTSWFYKTPELHRKAAVLQKVESQTLPAVTKQLAQAKTENRQLSCDKDRAVKVAVQGILADQQPGIDAPDWNDLSPCPKVAQIKAPPVSAILPKVNDPS